MPVPSVRMVSSVRNVIRMPCRLMKNDAFWWCLRDSRNKSKKVME